MATTPTLFICNQGASPLDNLEFEWPCHWKLPLAEPSRSILDRLRGTAGCAKIHLSEFGHLGRVGVIRPLGIPRLDLDHVSEMPRTEELLPSLQNIFHASLREVGHLGSHGLEASV